MRLTDNSDSQSDEETIREPEQKTMSRQLGSETGRKRAVPKPPVLYKHIKPLRNIPKRVIPLNQNNIWSLDNVQTRQIKGNSF